MNSLQYRRVANLIVGQAGSGVEVTDLRIDFRIVKTLTPEPNSAVIKVYNFSQANEAFVKSISQSEGTDVILNAGYADSPRLVFRGSIKNAYHYRKKTSLITEIEAGDGDKDYHNAFMNLTLAKGTTDNDLLKAAVGSFSDTTLGYTKVSAKRRSRGHAIFGSTRRILSKLARVNNAQWSIQDGELLFVPADAVLPNEAIVLNSQTGLLEVPQVTNKGVQVKALLNPQFRCNGVVKLDNNNIKFKPRSNHRAKAKGVNSAPVGKPEAPIKLDPDGLYKIIRIDMRGDTRGKNWTSELLCIGLGQPIPQNDTTGIGADEGGDTDGAE